MTIKIYKGYRIETMAEQFDDNSGWSASVCIYVNKRNHSSGRVFSVPEKHINQEEAIKHGLILGQRIIDGVEKDYSIEDFNG